MNTNYLKKLREAESKPEDRDSESIDQKVDNIQDETSNEGEKDSSKLDNELSELRDILPDIDLNLYQIIRKDNPNDVFYIIGKVADDTNDVLMLTSTEGTKDVDNMDNTDNTDNTDDKNEEKDNEDKNYNFTIIPNNYDDFVKLSPRYGEEQTPDHESVMTYLMKLLLDKDPEKAKELENQPEIPEEIPEETPTETSDNID